MVVRFILFNYRIMKVKELIIELLEYDLDKEIKVFVPYVEWKNAEYEDINYVDENEDGVYIDVDFKSDF